MTSEPNARDVIARAVNAWLDRVHRSPQIHGHAIQFGSLTMHPDAAGAVIAELEASGFDVTRSSDAAIYPWEV